MKWGGVEINTERLKAANNGATIEYRMAQLEASSGGGGGGLKGKHALINVASGGIVTHAVAGGSLPNNGLSPILYAVPFIPNQTITCSDLYINCTAIQVGSFCKIVVYSDTNGLPSRKLAESANLDTGTLGKKTFSTTLTFTAGTIYWLCVFSSGNASLTHLAAASLMPIGISSTAIYRTGITKSTTFGTAPDPFGAGTGYITGNAPAIFITKA